MRAVVLTRFGGPDVLESASLPDPVPGPGEVLLRVKACALNRLDLWARAGLPSAKIVPPFVLGCDVAGETDDGRFAVHPGRCCGACEPCRDGRESDCERYGIIGAYGGRQGGYAELIAVPREQLLPIPEGMSFVDAASLPLTLLTAWHMLKTLAELRRGETVLVNGAGSGVGTIAIQLARELGARVIAASTSPEKLQRAKALGAEHGIQHPPEELARTVRRLTGGRMADAVFEHVGGAVFSESVKCLRRSGRLVLCGATAGFKPELDLRYVFDRQLRVLGAKMGSLAEMRQAWELVRAGRVKPVVDRVFPLEQARQAHEHLESRRQFGKVVLSL